ncbi:MAG TPA: FAD-dependent oxidoreductase [Acidimicrobiales bacterium]|jgi:FAD-dependent urate hydroxylase
MQVVVVGAGIAGLALAAGLQRDGHDVRVLEEAPTLRTGGAAIAIWHNGAVALRQLGIDLSRHGQVINRLELWSAKGNQVGWVDAARLSGKFGIDAVTIGRGELLTHLADSVKPGTIKFGAPAVRAGNRPDSAVIEMGDGTMASGELVVGADGHRSAVRGLLADDSAVTPTGWASLQGLTAAPLALTAGATSIYSVGFGSAVGLMPAGHGLLQWWFDVPWTADTRPDSMLAWLRERFARWTLSPVRDLLDVIAEDEIEPFVHGWHRVPAQLSVGRVALIGDAVHAVPPVFAQGANQSIEDALVLVQALASATSVEAALARYGKERRAKMARLVRSARAPVLPFYGLGGRIPRGVSAPERLCTWSWGRLMMAFSSTLP